LTVNVQYESHTPVGRAFCYSNANLRKGEEAEEVFNFIAFWKRTHGELPRHLVFDSRLTTHANLARLDKMGISFITLRRRSPRLLKEIVLLPRSAWRTIELDVPTRKYRTPRVFEQKVSLAGATFRQLFIQDLGHDEPTILLCNQHRLSAKKLITRYAQRMLIENALSDAVRFFHLDALSSAVGLKIDSIWSFSSSPVVSIVYSPKPCAVIPMLKLAKSSGIWWTSLPTSQSLNAKSK